MVKTRIIKDKEKILIPTGEKRLIIYNGIRLTWDFSLTIINDRSKWSNLLKVLIEHNSGLKIIN